MVFAQNQKRHVVSYFPVVSCPCEVVKIGTLMNITLAKLLLPRFYLHLPRMCKWTLPRVRSVALLSSMPGRKPTKQYGQQCLQPLPSGPIPRCEGQQSLQSMPCTCHYRIARIGVSFRLWLPRRIHWHSWRSSRWNAMCSMRWRVGMPFFLKYSDLAVRRVNGWWIKARFVLRLHVEPAEPGPGQDNPLWVSNSFLVKNLFAWPRSQSFSNLWHISIISIISIISTWTFRTVLKIKTTTWTWILLSNPRWQGSVRAILLPQQIPCRFSTVDLMHGALEEHQDLKNESWKALHSIQCLTA